MKNKNKLAIVVAETYGSIEHNDTIFFHLSSAKCCWLPNVLVVRLPPAPPPIAVETGAVAVPPVPRLGASPIRDRRPNPLRQKFPKLRGQLSVVRTENVIFKKSFPVFKVKLLKFEFVCSNIVFFLNSVYIKIKNISYTQNVLKYKRLLSDY